MGIENEEEECYHGMLYRDDNRYICANEDCDYEMGIALPNKSKQCSHSLDGPLYKSEKRIKCKKCGIEKRKDDNGLWHEVDNPAQ